MKLDALDDYISVHLVRTRPDRAAKLEALWWPAFIAMWDRIGRDFVMDFIFYQALGTSLRNNQHIDSPPKLQHECRKYLAKAGMHVDLP